MKKQILTSLAAGLALAVLLCCGTGLAKANHHEQLGHKIEAELTQIEAEALLELLEMLASAAAPAGSGIGAEGCAMAPSGSVLCPGLGVLEPKWLTSKPSKALGSPWKPLKFFGGAW